MEPSREAGIQKEPVKLSTLSAVRARVSERAGLFASRLQEFTEMVKGVYAEKVDQDLGVNTGGKFTGRNLCIVASEELGSGIEKLVDFREIQPWLASLTLNPLHQIVKLIDMRSKEFLLLDPTYKQINSDFEDDILIIHPEQISDYYSTEITSQLVPEICEVNYSSWTLRNIPPQEVLDSKRRIGNSISE